MKNVPLAPKKITTNRFLFHVSHPSNRLAILKNGLVVLNKKDSLIPNGIYAHNTIQEPNFSWYPFAFIGEYDNSLFQDLCPVKHYDYWRIDTSLLPNEWYLDHAAIDDYQLIYNANPKHLFVYSSENIPVKALKLFRFQQEKHVQYISENGVLHIRNSKEFRVFS
ncbi:MAG: hypothetical protein ACEQR5_09970 [Moraxellaceae bacterium]